MVKYTVYVLFCIISVWLNIDPVRGRLTEFNTERFPILAHELQNANVDLKVLSKRALLGTRSEFRFKNGEFFQSATGVQRVRLVQTYAGYEVYGPTAVAELNMGGYLTGQMYGDVARNLHKDVPNPEACVKDVRSLLDTAIRLEKLHPRDPNIDNRDGRRVIYANPNERMARIVYVVEFFYTGYDYVSFPVYYMDACSNSVIFSYNKIKNMSIPQNQVQFQDKELRVPSSVSLNAVDHGSKKAGVFCNPSAVGVGGNVKSGKRKYNTQPLCLPVRRVNNLCRMEGTYAKVIDNQNSQSRNKESVVTFPCLSGYKDSVNGAYSVANDALYFGEKSGEFFNDKFKMRALPYVPRLVVHYGRNYENAFWTGTDMFFGDGKSTFYPLVSLDVVAHELAHGVTTRNSDLIYMGQAGGINEAFSDITGVVTRKYAQNVLAWTIGFDIMKSASKAMRYMNNPPLDGRSIKNAWFFLPLMNVHYSSGVFNYAFYKMVDSYNMDIYKAYECFLNANLNLWGKFTWFAKGACNVMQACYDAGYDFKDVRKAFMNTWLPLIFCRYSALKTTVFPGETRRNVLVNIGRSPILEVDMRKWRGRGVWATAQDLSVIRVLATTDGDGKNIIAKGNNYVAFPGNYTRVYIKLMSHHQSDVKVELKVLD